MSEMNIKGALRNLGKALGILDSRGISHQVATGDIQPVIGLDIGMLNYELVSCQTAGATGAITTFTWQIAGGGGASLPAILQPLLADTADYELLIMGWRIQINLTAVGDAANLKWLNFESVRVMGQNSGMATVREATCQRWGYYDWANGKANLVISSSPSMAYSLSGDPTAHQLDRPIWVPAGTSLQFQVSVDPVANFNVNAQYYTDAWGIKVPKGIRLPFM